MLWEAGPGKPIIWTSAGTEMLAKDSRRTLVAEEAIRCIGFRRSTHLCTIKMFPFPYRHGLWCQTSVLWPKSSPKCLQISQKGTCFKGFIDFLKNLCLSHCVCSCSQRKHWSLGAGVTGFFEWPDLIAGVVPLIEQQALWSTEPSPL